MTSVLFIMTKSPHESTGLELLPSLAGESERGVMLFEDAVYFAADQKSAKHLLEHVQEAFVLKDDLEARGFGGCATGKFREIDYHQAVEVIMERYDRTITV